VAWLEPPWNLGSDFFTWLKQKQQKSYYFSMENFSHNLTKIMPKSGLWMFYLYFAPKFKYFSLESFQKLSSKIFMHFSQLRVCLHFQHSSQVRGRYFKAEKCLKFYVKLSFKEKLHPLKNWVFWKTKHSSCLHQMGFLKIKVEFFKRFHPEIFYWHPSYSTALTTMVFYYNYFILLHSSAILQNKWRIF